MIGILAPLPEREGLGVGIAEGDFFRRGQKSSLRSQPTPHFPPFQGGEAVSSRL